MTRARPHVLTPRQQQIFEWVKGFIRDYAMPPTVREIGRAFDIESSSVFDFLKALERKGYLRRGTQGARSLILEPRTVPGARRLPVLACVPQRVRKRRGLIAVPVVGTVAAGHPILADQNIIGTFLVDADRVRTGRFFGLQVRGDSMIRADIRNGDTVLVRQQPLAESGDIVVAILSGDATVKRLYLRDGAMALRPENPAYPPITIHPEDDLRIAGKVVAVQHSGAMSE